jgi:hypothetical protein
MQYVKIRIGPSFWHASFTGSGEYFQNIHELEVNFKCSGLETSIFGT